MLRLAARMVRFHRGGFVATFVALAAGVAVLMTCALLVESGWRYQGEPQRYGATATVVADRDLRVAGPTVFGETEYTTVTLPERGGVRAALTDELAAVPGVARAVGDRAIAVTTTVAPDLPVTGHGGAIAAVTLTSAVNAVAGQRVPHVPAAGWAAVVGGTVALALVATALPVGRLLRTPPVEGIGIRE